MIQTRRVMATPMKIVVGGQWSAGPFSLMIQSRRVLGTPVAFDVPPGAIRCGEPARVRRPPGVPVFVPVVPAQPIPQAACRLLQRTHGPAEADAGRGTEQQPAGDGKEQSGIAFRHHTGKCVRQGTTR